ncbi:MAG: ATP-grasp domain-containing protein [Oscillospiraceae bacterium]|nr:ATP-grasp domain-containing protein [Oscillospiraceae bacterium]
MEKVLILGVAAVQLDAIVMLKKLGYEVHACAMAKDGPGADAADCFHLINIVDEAALEECVVKNKIRAVYSVGSDIAVPIACRLSEKLNLPAFVSSKTAYICNHKNKMRQALGINCSGNIPFQVMERCGPVKIEFPCIMKPSDSQGQRGIFLVRSQADVDRYFDAALQYSRERRVIIEHYVEGPELSVNGYMVDGNLRYMAISDRDTWPAYTGLIRRHIVPSVNAGERQAALIYDVFFNACRLLGINNGPAYFQIKLENGVPFIIEMTPRLDGCHMWSVLEKSTGVNLLRLTFLHLLRGDIQELDHVFSNQIPYELTFLCQKPNTAFDGGAFEIPGDSEYSFYYYQNGDRIRPVNGRFEKVGYYTRRS